MGDAAGSSDEPPTGGGEGEAVAQPVSRPSSRAVDVPEGQAPRPSSRAAGSVALSASGSTRGQDRLPTLGQSNRRRSGTHLTPISRPRRHDCDESPEGRPGDQIDQIMAMMMMNQSADREERRSDQEGRCKEFRLQLEMKHQQMQAQLNMIAMVLMSMLGRSAAAANNGV